MSKRPVRLHRYAEIQFSKCMQTTFIICSCTLFTLSISFLSLSMHSVLWSFFLGFSLFYRDLGEIKTHRRGHDVLEIESQNAIDSAHIRGLQSWSWDSNDKHNEQKNGSTVSETGIGHNCNSGKIVRKIPNDAVRSPGHLFCKPAIIIQKWLEQ